MTKSFALRPSRASMLSALLLALLHCSGIAQTCGPDCRALNLSITSGVDNEFHSKMFWTDLIPNFQCAAPVTYVLQTPGGSPVAMGSSDDVGNEVYILIDDPCRYLRDGLMIIASNNLGSCMNRLTFKKGILDFPGRKYDLSCLDPRVLAPDPMDLPAPVMACEGPLQPGWVGDWPVIYDCIAGVQDTAKVIYREWEVFDKDGIRYSSFDTLIVFRLPQLDAVHIFCPDRDTLYCGAGENFGPYWLLESDVFPGFCDTIPFINVNNKEGKITFSIVEMDKSCGLQLHLDTTKFTDGCEQVWKLDLEIKQECPGGPNMANCIVPAGNQPQPLDAAGTYWRCTFWVYDIDTLPPVAKCDYDHYAEGSLLWPRGSDASGANISHCFSTPSGPQDTTNAPVVMVSTGNHDCIAHTALPGLCIAEDWTGVGLVKASINGIGTFRLDRVDSCLGGGDLFESSEIVSLPLLEEPYQITYEIYDLCYNVDTVFCYILVKDGAKPVAVADKGVTVSLGGKVAWVDAGEFDEGSYDNCAVNLLLARRVDWSTAGIDLCDSVDSLCSYHDEVLFHPLLESDKYVNEIEAYYAQTLRWLQEDGGPCSAMLLNAWHFGLIEGAYNRCSEGHLTRQDLVEIFLTTCELDLKGNTEGFNCDPYSDYEKMLHDAAELGGGWAFEVPFTCEDACQDVTIEILVMDYWCNWSKSWTIVKVEDRSPINILQDLDDVAISCGAFKNQKHTFQGQEYGLEDMVDLAASGDDQALGWLDSIFGGYQKVWVNGSGQWINAEGAEVTTGISFEDSVCYCKDTIKQVAVYDDHLGMIWVDSVYRECYYEVTEKQLKKGIVGVNCAQNVQCVQSVWKDLDHCGEGYVYRKFQIWSGCPTGDSIHAGDTLTRIQRIQVVNSCDLDKAMFDVPGDVVVYACGIEYDPLGSGQLVGAANPDITGYPQYKFDDDCKIIGIAHEDKVFKVVGGDQACYKIIRTWYFADWCEYEGSTVDGWWRNQTYVADTCVQKIILVDTLAPVCLITGPVEDGGTIEAAGCNYDFFAELDVMDECGTIDYSYQIFNGETVTHQGFGQLEAFISNHVTIAAGNLSDGSYVLRVRTTDQCQNEGFCNYTFNVVTGKKPSPVCLSSITVELTPEDVDRDGSLDTAMALIWAEEFDVSSSAPCGVSDADLQFYIERINGESDFETLDTTVDQKFLSLGCGDVGTQMVRMWVLSPTGSSDFCDVYLLVQANSGGCPTSVPVFSNVEGSILTTDGFGVKDVTVNGALFEMTIESPSTDANGSYDMMFGLGEKVSITPAKDGDDINGVNTSDLLLLANHISNASPVSSPYLRIAGDVNFDGIINAFDILLMRDVILRNVPAWPDGDSWRFVPAVYSFTTSFPESEDFPESVEMELDQENMRADFVAMKIGDLDLDRNTQLAGRSAETMLMQIDDTPFKMGEKVEIMPYLPEEASLLGMQFELHFDPEALEFEGLKFEGELPVRDENFGLKYTEEGIIYFSWNEQKNLVINREELLFGFDFTAKSNGRPSESISLTGQRLSATGYPDIGVSRPIALSFNGSDGQIQVGQNMPNPFRQTTVIPIILADSDVLTLVVTDLSGKIVLKRRISGVAGKQEIEITSVELNAPGVYYYTIIDNNSTITNKMILLR